jgi:hypothetical protein
MELLGLCQAVFFYIFSPNQLCWICWFDFFCFFLSFILFPFLLFAIYFPTGLCGLFTTAFSGKTKSRKYRHWSLSIICSFHQIRAYSCFIFTLKTMAWLSKWEHFLVILKRHSFDYCNTNRFGNIDFWICYNFKIYGCLNFLKRTYSIHDYFCDKVFLLPKQML